MPLFEQVSAFHIFNDYFPMNFGDSSKNFDQHFRPKNAVFEQESAFNNFTNYFDMNFGDSS